MYYSTRHLQNNHTKQNIFIRDSSIIPIYDIEKIDCVKFAKLINEYKYIQDIEPTNESKQKGNYDLITPKQNYRKTVTEINEIVKYLYSDKKSHH